jgi:hypothetical protein
MSALPVVVIDSDAIELVRAASAEPIMPAIASIEVVNKITLAVLLTSAAGAAVGYRPPRAD